MYQVTDPAEYGRVAARVDAVFDRGARLPGRVLRRDPRRLAFFEFDAVFAAEFWEALRALAGHYGDGEVCCVAVEPDAETYYRAHFGAYGALLLPASAGGGAYQDALAHEPEDSPADSLRMGSRVLAFASASGGFGAWADRELELGVLALYDTAQVPAPGALPAGVRWLDAGEALAVMAPAFAGQRVPEGIRDALLASYGALAG